MTRSEPQMQALEKARRADASLEYYQRFFSVANASQAHSQFCRRVYGADLCQDGQTDMACLDEMIKHLGLRPDSHVLDLGCGAGGLAEYISDHTGSSVTGIDIAASAIDTADSRTIGKRDRLRFIKADMNCLEFPANTFDAAISLDSISWISDMIDSLSTVVRCIKPGGRICILTEQRMRQGDACEVLDVARMPVAQALATLNLSFERKDDTASLLKFWLLAKETAEALRGEFARDGAEFICDAWIRYADHIYLPAIHANRIKRYLYCIHV